MQPSELAKLAIVLFTAALLEKRMARINDLRYALVPVGIVVGLTVALILAEPDFGTSVSILLVVGLMVLAAGLNWRYIAACLLLAAPAIGLMVWLAAVPDAAIHDLL